MADQNSSRSAAVREDVYHVLGIHISALLQEQGHHSFVPCKGRDVECSLKGERKEDNGDVVRKTNES